MKKVFQIALVAAVMLITNSVNARSWRVCSNPEAGADFLSVAAAVESNSVFSGDTLYVEPGHHEIKSGTLDISKRLTLLGPGFYLNDNNLNVLDSRGAIFQTSVSLSVEGTNVYGCEFYAGFSAGSNTHIIERCLFNYSISLGGQNVTLKSCIFNRSSIVMAIRSSLIENNIFMNGLINSDCRNCASGIENSTFRNNTIIMSSTDGRGLIFDCYNTDIYNNIIINTNTDYRTTTNSDQLVDTIWYKDYVMNATASNGNNVYNNVLSCAPHAEYRNCVFNASVEDVLIWNNANTLEEKYKHKTNSVAMGAGLNGTTCGAYGQVNGGRAYQPAGIPQYRPFIYDAVIDDTPSSNNTINASFKIKVQQ